MPTILDNYVFVRVTADAATPDSVRVYDGALLGLSPEAVAALPSGIDKLNAHHVRDRAALPDATLGIRKEFGLLTESGYASRRAPPKVLPDE